MAGYGRFEAVEPNELWVGDALRGPVIVPAVGVRGYHAQIVETLGSEPTFHTYALIAAATGWLHAEVDERGKRVVIVNDEA